MSVPVVILACPVLPGQMFVEVTNDVANHRLLGGLQLDERSLWTRGALSTRVPINVARETSDACFFLYQMMILMQAERTLALLPFSSDLLDPSRLA